MTESTILRVEFHRTRKRYAEGTGKGFTETLQQWEETPEGESPVETVQRVTAWVNARDGIQHAERLCVVVWSDTFGQGFGRRQVKSFVTKNGGHTLPTVNSGTQPVPVGWTLSDFGDDFRQLQHTAEQGKGN